MPAIPWRSIAHQLSVCVPSLNRAPPVRLGDPTWMIRNLLITIALYEVAPNRAIAGMILKRCCSWLSKGDLAHVRALPERS